MFVYELELVDDISVLRVKHMELRITLPQLMIQINKGFAHELHSGMRKVFVLRWVDLLPSEDEYRDHHHLCVSVSVFGCICV